MIADKFINRIFDKDKLILIDEKENPVFSMKKKELIKNEKNEKLNIKKGIISDTLIDLKIITVPAVSHNILKSIIMNTIKKYTAAIPSDNNIDYIILDRVENQYEVLVFIKLFEDKEDLPKINLYSFYHIIQNIVNAGNFPENASILINTDNTWFLYKFKEKKFRKRDIYYNEDIKNFKKKNVYYLNILHNQGDVNLEDFIEIPSENVEEAVNSLNRDIFRKKKSLDKKILIISIAASLILIAVLFFELSLFRLNLEKDTLLKEKNALTTKLEEEKKRRGISDEKYRDFLYLIKKRSNLNSFFYNLYFAGKNNIRISSINYLDGDFSVTGTCANDSQLEDMMRESGSWKDVEFSFARENNKIKFVIRGKFIDERFDAEE